MALPRISFGDKHRSSGCHEPCLKKKKRNFSKCSGTRPCGILSDQTFGHGSQMLCNSKRAASIKCYPAHVRCSSTCTHAFGWRTQGDNNVFYTALRASVFPGRLKTGLMQHRCWALGSCEIEFCAFLCTVYDRMALQESGRQPLDVTRLLATNLAIQAPSASAGPVVPSRPLDTGVQPPFRPLVLGGTAPYVARCSR